MESEILKIQKMQRQTLEDHTYMSKTLQWLVTAIQWIALCGNKQLDLPLGQIFPEKQGASCRVSLELMMNCKGVVDNLLTKLAVPK